MSVSSINPTSQEIIETFEPHDEAAVEAAIARAADRFTSWRATAPGERASLLKAAAETLEARRDTLARTMTTEMGKPLAQAVAEVDKCALVCRHYAEAGARYMGDETLDAGEGQAFVRHLPLGPILAVMPWNFPLWQVFRFAAPALMAGNVGLLKHASNVWRCALEIESVLRDAGFPDGCFQTLLIGSDRVEAVLRDDRVRGATLTGSGPAGASVASIAGGEIKPSLLELGGSDAFIIMPSADLDAAVETAIDARTKNNGQSCIAAKRFFVHDDIYATFRERFVAGFEALTVGDPMQETTDIGPLAMRQLRDDLDQQVEASLAKGGRRLTSPRDLPGTGWFAAPDIIESAAEDAPAFCEELFGPVAGLWPVASLDEAIVRANASSFGLGSAVFTREEAEMQAAIDGLEAGGTFINAMVASDPRMPFGGVKQSGYGRELYRDGMLAFMNRKTVRIAG